jgi:hypothetical protein
MKSSVKKSRFVQPRRFESVSPETNSKLIVPVDDSTNEIPSSKSDTSPDCALSTESEESIADILCNLEQIYDRSFLKWDKIRREDEFEHALMRGTSYNATEGNCFQSDITHDHEKVDLPKVALSCNATEEKFQSEITQQDHERIDATRMAMESDDVHFEIQCILTSVNAKTELMPTTTTQRVRANTKTDSEATRNFDIRGFLTLVLFFLFLLRISHTQRV